MLILGVFVYMLAMILPALARSTTSWVILSVVAMLPAALIFWITYGSGDISIAWLVFLMWCLLASAAIGILIGGIALFGQSRRWRAARRPIPALLAFSLAIVTLVYGAVSATSVGL